MDFEIDPAFIPILIAVMVALPVILFVVIATLVQRWRRDRVRLDPMQQPLGDVTGWPQ